MVSRARRGSRRRSTIRALTISSLLSKQKRLTAPNTIVAISPPPQPPGLCKANERGPGYRKGRHDNPPKKVTPRWTPVVGEHSDEVLLGAGYTIAEIAALPATGVVGYIDFERYDFSNVKTWEIHGVPEEPSCRISSNRQLARCARSRITDCGSRCISKAP